MQSNFQLTGPEHVAIIMDGNGRWAVRRRLGRSQGHQAGARTVRTVVEAAVARGTAVLTLYAFSADNWRRPGREVAALMGLFERYLKTQASRCVAHGVRVSVIGRRDRLSRSLVTAIEQVEKGTRTGRGMHLRLAVDYSSRAAILNTASRLRTGECIQPAEFLARMNEAIHSTLPAPPVDLLVRTGGERRLSDFLLWECAYAELVFSDRLWPDFDAGDFDAALAEFARRDRRYGQVQPVALPRTAGSFVSNGLNVRAAGGAPRIR